MTDFNMMLCAFYYQVSEKNDMSEFISDVVDEFITAIELQSFSEVEEQ